MSQDAQFSHAHMVRFERPLAVSPQRAWQTLTDTRRLPGWYGEGVIEPRVGGKIELMGGAPPRCPTGNRRVVETTPSCGSTPLSVARNSLGNQVT